MIRLNSIASGAAVKYILRALRSLALSAFFVLMACDDRPWIRNDSGGLEVRELAANGVAGGVLHFGFRGESPFSPVIVGPLGDVQAIEILKREKQAAGQRLHFRSTVRPGRVLFFSNQGSISVLRFVETGLGDADSDGFPDAVELLTESDRRAFRAWFVRIAESQYLKPSYAWNSKERDCSGLIRFAYREALKKHDRRWQERSGVVLDKNLPDVERYNYPDVPLLGERIFRIGDTGDLKDSFADFANAGYLQRWNARRVSRDMDAALAGDLLFFWNPYNREAPYHSMIVSEKLGSRFTILYHTGGEAGIKRVPIAYLREAADAGWRPVPENKRFLGVFRFHILD